jgi:hypothetical protein
MDIALEMCVNPTKDVASQQKYIRKFVTTMNAARFQPRMKELPPMPQPQEFGLDPPSGSKKRIKANSGTLARVLIPLEYKAHQSTVPLDADERLYGRYIRAYLEEVENCAAAILRDGNVTGLCANKDAQARLDAVLAPFRAPVRYWVPGAGAGGKRGRIIVGLHWEPFLQKRYPSIVALMNLLHKFYSAAPFPRSSDPHFFEKYLLVEQGQDDFLVPHTWKVELGAEADCVRRSKHHLFPCWTPGCRHFAFGWWNINPELQQHRYEAGAPWGTLKPRPAKAVEKAAKAQAQAPVE